MTKKTYRFIVFAAFLGISTGLQATGIEGAQLAPPSTPTDNPFLDIQWDDPIVKTLLILSTGSCEISPNKNAEPIKDSPNSVDISMLRYMYYLANDYYSMGVNQYFMVRADVQYDLAKRNTSGIGLWPKNDADSTYFALLPVSAVALMPKTMNKKKHDIGLGYQVYMRHTAIDPFDQSMLSDQIFTYTVSKLIMPKPLPWKIGTVKDSNTHQTSVVGLRTTSSFIFPGLDRKCKKGSDGKIRCEDLGQRFDKYLYETPGTHIYTYPAVNFWKGQRQFPETMNINREMVCLQWRMEQERFRAGKPTAQDLQLQTLEKLANVPQREKIQQNRWIIPAQGF